VQGLAIASMHYTAMAATYFAPADVPADLTTPLFAQNLLAFMIAGAMVVLCAGNLMLCSVGGCAQRRCSGYNGRWAIFSRFMAPAVHAR
jgi:hypothetical protein